MQPPTENHHSDTGSGRVREAADYYRTHREICPHPVVPFLVLTFGLTGPREAIEALRIATMGGADG